MRLTDPKESYKASGAASVKRIQDINAYVEGLSMAEVEAKLEELDEGDKRNRLKSALFREGLKLG
jgi:hypothetical protein